VQKYSSCTSNKLTHKKFLLARMNLMFAHGDDDDYDGDGDGDCAGDV